MTTCHNQLGRHEYKTPYKSVKKMNHKHENLIDFHTRGTSTLSTYPQHTCMRADTK